jgi:UDP-N-acetylmuramyl pentapeptide phosphotransferase/UDP-N-acetylglucosamine-1-phosphate transferase
MLTAIEWSAISALVTWGLGFALQPWLAARGLIDHPNERSSHRSATVRGGGLSIVVVVGGGGLMLALGQRHGLLAIICGAATLLGAVSFVDDWRGLHPATRFVCHMIAGAAVLLVLLWPELRNHRPGLLGSDFLNAVSFLFLLLWVVGYTNAFNFMDGINGLAGGQAAITGLGMALLGRLSTGQWSETPILISLVVAGAALGFLPHNFPQARMFLGDVGSVPMGFLLATLVVWLARDCGWQLLIPLSLLHANFVLDTSITIYRRFLRRERWYSPHREHFYQRLVRAGRSHPFVTLREMALQMVVVSLMALYVHVGAATRLGLIAVAVASWLAFFYHCELQFQKSCERQNGEPQACR